jgi:hypothetical protein
MAVRGQNVVSGWRSRDVLYLWLKYYNIDTIVVLVSVRGGTRSVCVWGPRLLAVFINMARGLCVCAPERPGLVEKKYPQGFGPMGVRKRVGTCYQAHRAPTQTPAAFTFLLARNAPAYISARRILFELELKLTQTQMAQKPMLRVEEHARTALSSGCAISVCIALGSLEQSQESKASCLGIVSLEARSQVVAAALCLCLSPGNDGVHMVHPLAWPTQLLGSPASPQRACRWSP